MRNAATLRLFNAIQVENKDKEYPTVLRQTIKHGYVLDLHIDPSAQLLNTIENIVGISGEKANAAFHKSWSIIQDSDIETLIIQQILHYFTTYGFESLGIYNKDTVYIPHEKLELPEIKEDLPLTVIKAMTAKEILDQIIELGSGIALAQKTLDDIMIIIKTNDYDDNFVEQIKNRELKALLYDFFGIVPSEPVEFLRHLISKLTDESLIIKNDYLINKIKESNGKFLDELMKKSPENLASIFLRYKPLFLAMKSISKNKGFFNRLRKKAKDLHKPLPIDYLNSITMQIKNGELDLNILKIKLKKASVFRKIRLAYALKYRKDAGDSILYRIRNGRGWATDFHYADELKELIQEALYIVINSIVENIDVSGKTIYIPSNVHYALPATEKQFTGFFPTGSYISVHKDMIVGIYWENTDKRVDLDLSVISEDGKTGWDSAYRSEDMNVLFSGDITDAHNGASELFYLKQGEQEPKIMMLNYYNFDKDDEVDVKMLVAHEKPEIFGSNYMVNVNNIIATTNINITKKQNILGLAVNTENENRFYFANVSIGNSITSTNNKQSAYVRKYLIKSFINSIDLQEILKLAGANIVTEKPDCEYVNLSPENLDKMTIINLIKEKITDGKNQSKLQGTHAYT